MKNSNVIEKLSEKFDSFYLYDESKILDSIGNLKRNFKGIKFLYSLKTNPNPYVLDTIYSCGIGADAASLEEVKQSSVRGVKKENLQFSAPGKSRKDIEESIEIATVIADSINEVKMIDEVAKEKNIIAKIGVRINPNFTFYTDNGVAGKFGVDEDAFFEFIKDLGNYKNINLVGIHVHSKSQELDYRRIENYYKNLIELFKRCQKELNSKLEFLNMGSGIGIPYELDEREVDIESLGESLEKFIEESKKELGEISIYIETGRYIVGKSGVYVTKVMDKKVSHGETFVILNNTLNGFYRPSISQMVKLYKEEDATPNEPLFTSFNSTQIYPLKESSEKERVNLMGNLCTAADVIAKNVEFPKLEIGDLVVMTNAGSYSYVLTPLQFASMNRPKEILLKLNNTVVITK